MWQQKRGQNQWNNGGDSQILRQQLAGVARGHQLGGVGGYGGQNVGLGGQSMGLRGQGMRLRSQGGLMGANIGMNHHSG